jgi:putative nucleotidyltransferase with HDIG domain
MSAATINETDRRKKDWVHKKLDELFESEHLIPAFSTTVARVTTLVNDPRSQLSDVSAVISMDPSLAARCLKTASSVAYGGVRLDSIDAVVMRLGLREIRRVAMTVGVLDQFSRLRVKVDWSKFWMHSILVARLTEKLAAGFREPTGQEYLAGLLHDIGKLIIEHCFPREFESIYLRAMERHCGHVILEENLLGTDHAKVGGMACEHLKLHPDIISAIRFHHEPENPYLVTNPHGDHGFLAACVAVADAMANRAEVNLEGASITSCEFEDLPEWHFLSQFEMVYGLEIDTEEEVRMAKEDLQSMR